MMKKLALVLVVVCLGCTRIDCIEEIQEINLHYDKIVILSNDQDQIRDINRDRVRDLEKLDCY